MNCDSTVNVTVAQAQLPKLLKRDSFAVSKHGRVVGVFLSKERIEALVESMELLADAGFNRALREYEAGKTKFYDVAELDAAMTR